MFRNSFGKDEKYPLNPILKHGTMKKIQFFLISFFEMVFQVSLKNKTCRLDSVLPEVKTRFYWLLIELARSG